MKKLPCSKKVLECALVSISALKSFEVVGWGGVGARPILMSTPGPYELQVYSYLDFVQIKRHKAPPSINNHKLG